MYVGLACDNVGFLALNNFLSHHAHSDLPFPEQAPDLDSVFFIYPYEEVVRQDKKSFSHNEYIGVRWQQLNKLHLSDLSVMREKAVLLQPVTFRNKRDFNTHRLLRAIDNNTLLSKLDPREEAQPDEIMQPRKELEGRFSLFSFILDNTQKLIDSCRINFDFSDQKQHQNKLSFTESKQDDERLIHQLCQDGLSYRYDRLSSDIQERLQKELDIIKQQNYIPFFLINWDIVRYAKSKGYYHVGRGSGANSIVAYLLGITDVDPIELDLYFERFMNMYRTSPPDFDIDFSWRDREDVTRYIFEKYGKNGQAALLATYNTFKHSAAIRELGKVFGLPKHEIDKLSDGKYNKNKLDELSQLVLKYADELKGRPNYLSIHAGGIIISEKPIHYFTATNLPPKGFPTTQFDMVVAEDVGLNKYDILGQRGLGKIKDALQLVKINKPHAPEVDVHNAKPFFVDDNINRLVSQADCIGCFYVESPAMRMLLRKLEVDNYLGLVAASSIIRPGVAKSGMMREYILRHQNPERREDAHPVLKDIMPETYGVMVYQEDVIKVAHYFADLSLSEADVLRRGMSGKYRSRAEFDKVRQKFIDNCTQKGYSRELTLDVWRQIESFAGYAFAKGHSASYAVESYQSLYLKTYYPLEYMVAVINNGGGFYRTELYVREAEKLGGIIHPPCVNRSLQITWLYGAEIYLGLNLLSGLDGNVIQRIVNERLAHGDYDSLEDFIHRVAVGIEQLDVLIRIEAFRFTGVDKRTLLWKARHMLNFKPQQSDQRSLFDYAPQKFELPRFPVEELENAFDQMELLGFPLCNPFLLLKEQMAKPILLSKELPKYIDRPVTIYGYLITIKNTTTSNGKRMQFGTFLDYSGDWIDTVHFPPIAAKYPFRGKGVYSLTGKVVEEFGFYTLEVSRMEKLPHMEDVRFVSKSI